MNGLNNMQNDVYASNSNYIILNMSSFSHGMQIYGNEHPIWAYMNYVGNPELLLFKSDNLTVFKY